MRNVHYLLNDTICNADKFFNTLSMLVVGTRKISLADIEKLNHLQHLLLTGEIVRVPIDYSKCYIGNSLTYYQFQIIISNNYDRRQEYGKC